jgi:competence protein ComEA
MLKKILVLLALLYAAVSFAATDVNKATAAELDAVKGIGPAMSKRIVDERKKGDFKSWEDLITRVKGIGDKSASNLSEAGLTVKGETFKKASKEEKKEAKAAAKEEKKESKADKKDEKKETKAEKKEEKAAAKAEKKEAKAEKKDEKAKK